MACKRDGGGAFDFLKALCARRAAEGECTRAEDAGTGGLEIAACGISGNR